MFCVLKRTISNEMVLLSTQNILAEKEEEKSVTHPSGGEVTCAKALISLGTILLQNLEL